MTTEKEPKTTRIPEPEKGYIRLPDDGKTTQKHSMPTYEAPPPPPPPKSKDDK